MSGRLGAADLGVRVSYVARTWCDTAASGRLPGYFFVTIKITPFPPLTPYKAASLPFRTLT